MIKAKHGPDTYTCCLQSVDHIWVFWNVFGRFTDNLRCCKNLFSSEKVQGVCPKCNDQGMMWPDVASVGCAIACLQLRDFPPK